MQFIDLQRQYQSYKEEIRAEMDAVLDTSSYILGPAVTELEQAMAAYLGVKHGHRLRLGHGRPPAGLDGDGDRSPGTR